MSKEQFEKIEAQLRQAQQERAEIQDKLSQILSLVEPFKGLQLFDPSEFQLQLREIQAQLRQAEQERSHLQSQIAEVPSRLSQDLATQLYQLLSSQLLSEIQTQLQQVQQEQKQLQSLLSELPSQVSQLVKTELEKAQLQTTVPTTSQTAASVQNEPLSVERLACTRLRELLAAGKWKEADRETKLVILQVSGLEQEAKLDKEHLENFSCESLRTIDQLWVKYSNGRFGFSVQKHLFESVGGKPGVDDYKAYCRFGERVGWLVKNCWLSETDLIFTLDAPSGHLPLTPFLVLIRGIRSRKLFFSDFFRRIEACKV
jgi:predicted XRE-type DNA-binding protein